MKFKTEKQKKEYLLKMWGDVIFECLFNKKKHETDTI